ncbi:MAG: HEPN domain-containing protein [Nitrospinae bacterium]|nr:HEPN domain-containing protein [Nitrospinota bacterium]
MRLLLQDGLSSSKHTGVRSLFNRHDVRTGKVPKHLAPIYNDLFERCQEGDYMDFVDFEEAQVRPWIARADNFIDHIASLIVSKRA